MQFANLSNPLAPNFWQRSEPEQNVHDNMRVLRRLAHNNRLCQILERKVAAVGKTGTRIGDVARITKEVREEIDTLEQLNLEPLDYHDRVVPILSQACIELNNLRIWRQKRGQLQQEIDNAVRVDRTRLEKNIKWQPKSTQQTIRIFFMDNPEKPPHTITETYSQYKEIRWYLISEDLVDVSDMWIRHSNAHELTPKGHRWNYLNPKDKIDTTLELLEIDVVDIQQRGEYIVALLHENDKEIPIPLDIAKGGGRCCDPNCGNLRNHLNNIWQTRAVRKALRFSDPTNSIDVFSCVLNDESFDHRTNDLYLKCEPREEKKLMKQN
ncbi:hypothetical protein CPB86DRAFT_782470 [Serendipita vermifera]|nr:hypothetical protein CPB86DRAFT_782470 [Serendipita vermifera]